MRDKYALLRSFHDVNSALCRRSLQRHKNSWKPQKVQGHYSRSSEWTDFRKWLPKYSNGFAVFALMTKDGRRPNKRLVQTFCLNVCFTVNCSVYARETPSFRCMGSENAKSVWEYMGEEGDQTSFLHLPLPSGCIPNGMPQSVSR